MNRESFPNECSVEQWLSLALSIQMKQTIAKVFPKAIWIKSSEQQNFSLT